MMLFFFPFFLQTRSILRSYGTQVEALLSRCCHIYTHLGILIAGEVEKKGKTEILVNVW